jgi:hypothetical protein
MFETTNHGPFCRKIGASRLMPDPWWSRELNDECLRPALTLAAATGLTEGPPLPLGPPGAPAGGLWGFGKAPLEVELHGTCFCCLFFGVKVDVWTYSWMCPIQELGPMAGYWWLDWNEHPTALTRLMDGIWLQLGHVGRLEYVASLLWTCSLLKGWVIITKDQLLKLGFHE